MRQTRVQTTTRRREHAPAHDDLVFASDRPTRVVREAERIVGLIDRALQRSR
jgi:hypothetical protein